MKRKRRRPLQWFRYAIQFIVAAYALVIVLANTAGQNWAANLHTICPFGGVVNIYTYAADGGYVAKLHSAVFVMLLALIIGLVLTGKSFCGWICPLGSVQQALGWVGQRLWPRAYNRVPRWLERILQYLKWVVLAWVLVQTARSGQLIFQDWDPYYNLYHVWTDEVAISGYAVTGVTLVLALFVPRAFCRYACPLGAVNGIFNSFSFIGIKRDATTCTDCGRCTKACPVNIDVCASTAVRSVECTRCLLCIEACPQNAKTGSTLTLRTWFSGLGRSRRPEAVSTAAAGTSAERIKRRSVSLWVFSGIAIAAFVLPILITNLTGDFQITGGGRGAGGGGRESPQPADDQSTAEPDVTGTTGEEATGEEQAIRGMTTLAEIQAMGIDIAGFMQEFGIPADTPLDTSLRDLTDHYGFTVPDVRTYVEDAGK